MTCKKCNHDGVKKFGKYGKKKIQRYRCQHCSVTFAEPRLKPLGNHYIDTDKAAQVITLMMEGMSIRGISRVTGLHKTTILSLLLTLGDNCRRVFEAKVIRMQSKFVSADEMYGLVHTRENRIVPGNPLEWGASFLWVALDDESKAVVSYHVGKRTGDHAQIFLKDLFERVEAPFQLTTDAYPSYLTLIDRFWSKQVAYAQLTKVYGKSETGEREWYGPPKVTATTMSLLRGRPDADKVSTSYIERFNLGVRTCLRRYTRLSLGFSKSLKHLQAAVNIFMAWYNLCRIHGSTRVTPMMEAGKENHAWTVRELIEGATQI
jgi:transposase-like protein/IS1 family transposase